MHNKISKNASLIKSKVNNTQPRIAHFQGQLSHKNIQDTMLIVTTQSFVDR